jgi:hypothetical protein
MIKVVYLWMDQLYLLHQLELVCLVTSEVIFLLI